MRLAASLGEDPTVKRGVGVERWRRGTDRYKAEKHTDTHRHTLMHS